MSLVELIAQADTRGLAASGLACLDRCLPLLDGDDEALRPLWATLADDAEPDWAGELAQVRATLARSGGEGEDEAVLLARVMLADAPDACSGPALRAWADACSAAALRVHRLLDPAADTNGPAPLVAGELRRQVTVLDLLAAHGPAGLRPALEVSTEGRRVLRAVVSRRARGRDARL
ncbi:MULTISPECIES: hypothetical protein [unclassified Streptomyces]|uniref:hypothetical protein n=1 Tax=unclassified Streptomyces TaxID=2593676 RepID=UPI000F02A6DB|nr:hypothetical protein [Streptomyces sp. Tu 4128]